MTYLLGGPFQLCVLAVFLRTAPEFLWRALSTTGRCLGPWQPGVPDPRVERPGTAGEPAHFSYWFRQVWKDIGSAARSGARAVEHTLTKEWYGRITRNLLRGHRPSGTRG
ncbi:hypothetical protein ACQEVX_29720 [Streptomyces syringium]|uniref:hypothetical protein n=1 Tax=Streptomyces syringium TaxID=76729 RepID=UPI003D93CF4D